ncbi:hypothetical protein D3C72_1917700 [compost metagenome]
MFFVEAVLSVSVRVSEYFWLLRSAHRNRNSAWALKKFPHWPMLFHRTFSRCSHVAIQGQIADTSGTILQVSVSLIKELAKGSSTGSVVNTTV